VYVSVFEAIRRELRNLTPSERKVARVLLSGRPTMGLESSARLAQFSGVSGPTVSRFVTRLGYASYADFQESLRHVLDQRVREPVDSYPSVPAATAPAGDLTRRCRDTFVTGVTSSLDLLDDTEFDAAVSLLSDPKSRVMASGGWFSHHLASYLIALLQELRPDTHLVSRTTVDRSAALSDTRTDDVVVLFDFRRYESDTIALAREMRRVGARIILVTDRWLSPIAEMAKVVLPVSLESPSPFDSLTPAVALIETLMTGVVERTGEAGLARFRHFGSTANRIFRTWHGENDRDDPA
jgi:DNA-binding MurR/RpiR family transcriptional regulator